MAFPLPLTEATMAPLPLRPQTATHKLVSSGWEKLSEWSNSLLQATAEVLFIPWLYLYLDFVLHTDSGGIKPTNAYKKWTWLSRDDAGQYDLVLRVKRFRLMLLRVHRLEIKMQTSQYARPSSHVICFWARCVCCRMHPQRLKAVENYLQKFNSAFLLGKDVEIVTT